MKILGRSLTVFFGFFISLAALIWLAGQFDFDQLVETSKRLEGVYLIPVPFFITASFALRAQRWRMLVEHTPPIRFGTSFTALMIGYLLNNILPARAGDFARALELGKSEQMSRTKVFATLVTERAADLLVSILLLALALLTYPALPEWLKKGGVAVAFVAVSAMSLLFIAHVSGKRWIPGLVSRFTRHMSERIGDRLGQMSLSALEGIAGIFRPSRAAVFLSLSGLLWIIEVSMICLVAAAAGISLAPGNALFVLLVLVMGSLVPSSPGFVGTYEFFGIAALKIVGHEGPTALAFIILLHVLTILGSTILGVFCLLLRRRIPVSQGETSAP